MWLTPQFGVFLLFFCDFLGEPTNTIRWQMLGTIDRFMEFLYHFYGLFYMKWIMVLYKVKPSTRGLSHKEDVNE
jgi:hypothetical protein